MANERYDVAIIGTGPAGISAAITAKVRNKSVIIFGNDPVSSKVSKAHEILNYPGLPNVKGEDLAKNLTDHLSKMDLAVTKEQVLAAYGFGDYFSILTTDNNLFEATTLIVATGVNFGKPYPGEERFLGQGVSYCATCDAAFYRGKTVAVIGSAPKEEHEADFLAETCEKVYYIPLYKEETNLKKEISVIRKKPLYIEGDMRKKRLILQGEELEVDGIFILRDSVPPAQLIPGIALDGPHISVNRMMETSIPGCFACGDITGAPYQYIKAAGEGNVAALSAVGFIAAKK